MTEQQIDFLALAAIQTNEQKILATLERIEAIAREFLQLLPLNAMPPTKPIETAAQHAEKIAALQAKVPAARRK